MRRTLGLTYSTLPVPVSIIRKHVVHIAGKAREQLLARQQLLILFPQLLPVALYHQQQSATASIHDVPLITAMVVYCSRFMLAFTTLLGAMPRIVQLWKAAEP